MEMRERASNNTHGGISPMLPPAPHCAQCLTAMKLCCVEPPRDANSPWIEVFICAEWGLLENIESRKLVGASKHCGSSPGLPRPTAAHPLHRAAADKGWNRLVFHRLTSAIRRSTTLRVGMRARRKPPARGPTLRGGSGLFAAPITLCRSGTNNWP